MDLNQIFQVLASSDKEAQENSPFKPFSDFAGQLGQSIVQASPKAKTGEAAVLGLLTGLGGGFAQNLTDGYRERQNTATRDLLSDALSGRAIERPSGMSPSAFSNVQNAGSIFRAEQELATQQAEAQSKRELKNTITQEMVKGVIANPYKAERAKAALAELFGGQAPAAAATEVSPTDKRPLSAFSSDQPTATADATVSPTNSAPAAGKTFDQYMEQFKGDETLARAAVNRDLEAPVKAEDELSKMRNDFTQLQEVKNFTLSDIGIRSMRNAFLDTSGTSDQELVRGGVQAIEPGLAVQGKEQDGIAASGSIPAEYKGYMLGALTGQTKLPPEVREGIMRIAERRYREYGQTFNMARKFTIGEATRRNLPNPEAITYHPEATLFADDDVLTGRAPYRVPGTPAPTATPQPTPINSDDPRAALALQFPPTPEGRAAFREALLRMSAGDPTNRAAAQAQSLGLIPRGR